MLENNTNRFRSIDERLTIIRIAQQNNFAPETRASFLSALEELFKLCPVWNEAVLEQLLSKLSPEITHYIFRSYLDVSAYINKTHAQIIIAKLNNRKISADEKLLALSLVPFFVNHLEAADIAAVSGLLKDTEAEKFKSKAAIALLFTLEYGSGDVVKQAAFASYAEQEWQHIDSAMSEKAFRKFAAGCSSCSSLMDMIHVCVAHGNYAEAEILCARMLELAKKDAAVPILLRADALVQLVQIKYLRGDDSENISAPSKEALNLLKQAVADGLIQPDILFDLASFNELDPDTATEISEAATNVFSMQAEAIGQFEPAIVDEELAKEYIGKILIKFENWLATKSLKPSTRRVYVSRLRQFIGFIKLRCLPTTRYKTEDVLSRMAEEFIAYAANEYKLKPASVNNFVTLFRLIAKVAGLNNLALERPVSTHAIKNTLDEGGQLLYLNASKSGSSARDRLLVLFFLKTSIRIGEAVNVQVSDLIWDAGEQKIRIKGRSAPRIEVLDKTVRQALQDWLMERSRSSVASRSLYLFPGASGGRLTTTAVDMVLRKIGYRAGLNVSARVLRNTRLATLQAGMPEEAGSSDLNVPRYYPQPNNYSASTFRILPG